MANYTMLLYEFTLRERLALVSHYYLYVPFRIGTVVLLRQFLVVVRLRDGFIYHSDANGL
jgi:hypothetical protein